MSERRGRPRVMIVEDEPRLRDLLLEAIPDMGFDAVAARNADEAIALFETSPREILLLDLRLPGLGGLDLLELIRKRWPGTQAIMLTAYGDLAAAQRAMRLEVTELLTKPCAMSELEAALERARQRCGGMTARPPSVTAETPKDSPRTLAELEQRHILDALARHAGNRTAAAAELGISRRTLHYRLKDYRFGAPR